MFLKFSPYRKKNGVTVFRAVVVRAYRDVITGLPRQQHVSTVCGIPALAIGNPAAQLAFWASLETTLSRLQISETERARVRRSAVKRIPRPVSLGLAA